MNLPFHDSVGPLNHNRLLPLHVTTISIFTVIIFLLFSIVLPHMRIYHHIKYEFGPFFEIYGIEWDMVYSLHSFVSGSFAQHNVSEFDLICCMVFIFIAV